MKRLFFEEILNLKEEINKLQNDKDNVAILAQLQETLLDYHCWLEKKHHIRKERFINLQRMKKFTENTKEVSLLIKSAIKINRYQLNEIKELKLWLRHIGNSIPHIYYHKGDLRAYSYSLNDENLKELSGDIFGKDGLELELEFFRGGIEQGYKTLLNDLTSIIRYGDITIMEKEIPFIVEVKKSSATSKKADKQLRNMKEIQKYLLEDVSKTIRGGDFINKRIAMSEDEESNKDALNKHFFKSKGKGYELTKIEDGFYCFSYFHSSNYKENLDLSALDGMIKPTFFSLNKFKNEEDHSLFYPYSLSIEDPVIFSSFITGLYSIYFVFDSQIIDDSANKYNLEYEFIPEVYAIEMWGKEGVKAYSKTLIKALVEFSSVHWAVNQMFNNYRIALEMQKDMQENTIENK